MAGPVAAWSKWLKETTSEHETSRATVSHQEAVDARRNADAAADRASAAVYEEAVISVAKGSIDRARASAEFVQKAATAIFALYTGVLALVFSVTDNRLPARGVLPSFFLGLAIVGASAYLAFLTKGRSSPLPKAAMGFPQRQLNRVQAFVEWTSNSARTRAPLLQCAVIALGMGVFFLPAPFLTPPSDLPFAEISCVDKGQDEDATTGACLPKWPDIPQGSPGDAALRQKLFDAQLAEVAEARAGARADATRAPDDARWVIAGILGGSLIVTIPLMVAGIRWLRDKTRGITG